MKVLSVLAFLALSLLPVSVVWAAAQATVLWMEPAPPAPPPVIEKPRMRLTSSGNLALGYQSVKDASGAEKGGSVGKVVVNVGGEDGGRKVSGVVQLNRQFMTTGDLKGWTGGVEIKQKNAEFSLSHNLSDTGNIAARIYNLNHIANTQMGLKLATGENSLFSFNYSKLNNESSSAGTLQQRVDTEQKGLMANWKNKKGETEVRWDSLDNASPLTGYQTAAKTLRVQSIQSLSDKFQWYVNLQSAEANSKAGRAVPTVYASTKQYTTGLITQLAEKVQLKTSFFLMKNEYNSAGKGAGTETRGQEYILSYELLPPFALETVYHISSTPGLSETRRLFARLAFAGINGAAPRGLGLGPSNLQYQLFNIKDREGRLVSENNQVQLNVPLRLGENTNLMGMANLGRQKAFTSPPPVTRSVDTRNYSLTLSHRASPSATYNLQYNSSDTETTGLPSSSTDNYLMRADFAIKSGGQDIPVSITRVFASSGYGPQGTQNGETSLAVQVPTSKPQIFNLKYFLARTHILSQLAGVIKQREATKHTLHFSLNSERRDLFLNGMFNFIDTDKDMLNTAISFVYQKPKSLRASVSFFKNEEYLPPFTFYETRNLFLEISYIF